MTLRDAYELIRDEENWTKGALARDAEGFEVLGPNSDAARQWCAMGALHKCHVGVEEYRVLCHAVRALFPETKPAIEPLVIVNDRFGHDAVVQVFEKALVEVEGGV